MYLDLLFIIILLVFAFLSYRKGIIYEILSIFFLGLNIVISKQLTPIVYSKLNVSVDKGIASTIVYTLLFIAVYIVFGFVLKLFRFVITKSVSGSLDKILGMILGIIKGIILSIFLLFIITFVAKYQENVEKQLDSSRISKIYAKAQNVILPMIPKEISDTVKKYTDEKEIKKVLKEALDKRGK
ncbi:MAG: rane protein required for colicin production [Fusobacteriaceae bacterium]|jgi:membrane protein required for colicin V production|nr:putative colicin production protein CvpA [Fusobacteriales bacterium]MDN5303524.1 rane protein required for colicin production [Fusobacteriaceae bacterium]